MPVVLHRFFGGAPKLLVPDNLKSGVNKASFYDRGFPDVYSGVHSAAWLRARTRSNIFVVGRVGST
jgi:transposase